MFKTYTINVTYETQKQPQEKLRDNRQNVNHQDALSPRGLTMKSENGLKKQRFDELSVNYQ